MYVVTKCLDCEGYGFTETHDPTSSKIIHCFECDGVGAKYNEESYDNLYEAQKDYGNRVLRIED